MILAVRTLHVLLAQPGLLKAAGRLGHSNLKILEDGVSIITQ